MNKYQEAKDFIMRTLNDQYDGTLKLKAEALETLQELIDIQSINEESYNLRHPYVNKLERALDKACETIEELEKFYQEQQYAHPNCKTKNEWKEYLLQESEKEK